MDYKKIQFGKASAEAEGMDSPELLIAGYLDANGLTERAIQGREFLFLGYKGSGKTALGEHLRLRSESENLIFTRHVFLSEFPFQSFQNIVSGTNEAAARFPIAWSWLLLVYLIDSFSNDNEINSGNAADYEGIVANLRKIGLLPAKSLKELALISSNSSFKLNLPFDFGVEVTKSGATSEDLRFLHLAENLKRLVCTVNSSSKHLIVIDGLDDILTSSGLQYESLAALIKEAQRLNRELTEAGVPAKFVILCRTDLFERLPIPNKNKIRQDFAIDFEWYHDPREPASSQLVALANLRARLVYPNLDDIFKEFFPYIRNQSAASFLLNLTRHTPRDFLQLLNHLGHFYRAGRFSTGQIQSGVRDYSIRYFLPEIKDELVGYLSPEEGEGILQLLASMGRRHFTFAELERAKESSERHHQIRLDGACEALYECSAIGHITFGHQKNYFSFKYRNRHSNFNPQSTIILHRGVWKAMNLPE